MRHDAMAGTRVPETLMRYHIEKTDPRAVREIVASTDLFDPNEIELAVELVRESLSRGPTSGYQFVFAEQGSLVVGYACFGPIPITRDRFDLYWIAVRRECQGKGVACRMMAELERLVAQQGGQRIYVETSGRPVYQSARGLYEKCGYQQAAMLPDFYAPADDKIIYCKAI